MFRNKALHTRGFLVVCMILISSMILSAVSVQADTLRIQESPSLSGYKIYFAESNGEASRFDRSEAGLSRLGGVLWQLGAEMETLEWRTGIPADADLIVLAGPTTQLSADQTARLWSYLEGDGSLLILADPVIGMGNRQQGIPSNAPLFSLMWSDMGIRVRDDAIVTEGATQDAPLTENLITTNVEAGDPLTDGIEGELAFFRARSIQIDSAVQTFQTTALIFAPDNYYGEVGFNDYLMTGEAAYNIGTDTARGPLTLVATSVNPATNSRVALFGDRDFATNGGGLQSSPRRSASFLYPENVRFLVRTIAWLLEADTSTAAELLFPTPGPTATPTITPTPVVINADLVLTAEVNTDTPEEGEAVIYTFTIANNGPDTAVGINVNIPAPEGMTFISASATTRQGFDARNNNWNAGDLAPQATGTVNLVFVANEGTSGSTITITGTATANAVDDPNLENNTASIDIQILTGDEG